MTSQLMLLLRLTYIGPPYLCDVINCECRVQGRKCSNVTATKNTFRAYRTATALTKTATAIYTPTQERLRLKMRRISRWRMLKTMIWRVAHSCRLGSQAEFVLGPDESKSNISFIG